MPAEFAKRVGWGAALVAIVGAAIAIKVWAPTETPLVAGAVMAAILLVTLAVMTTWWRRVDKAVRDAHKTAWYWGASAGLVLSAIGVAALLAPGGSFAIPALYGRAEPAAYVALGALATMALQVLCALAVWAGWRLAKR